jgi:hypothetical protein
MTRHQGLLIVVLVAGLVGMHHLLIVCTGHAMPMARATRSESSSMTVPPTSATPIQHADLDAAGKNPVEASAMVTSQADCCDPMDMVGHFCLAVLTAITGLLAALIVAVARRRALASGHLLVDVNAVAARAPPLGDARLTQLCVLRR